MVQDWFSCIFCIITVCGFWSEGEENLEVDVMIFYWRIADVGDRLLIEVRNQI